MLNMLWYIGGGLFVGGLLAVLLGLRRIPPGGRRCGGCGYDLSGTPAAHQRCPECGGDLDALAVQTSLSADAITHRRRLRRWGGSALAAGFLVITLTLLFDPRRIPFTPTPILVHFDAWRAARSSEAVAAPIHKQIGTRHVESTLDDAALRVVIDRLLEPTTDLRDTASARSLLMHAWIAGVLTPEELTSMEAIWPVLWLKPTVGSRAQMPIDIEVDYDFTEPMSAGLVLRIEWKEILIDDVSFATGRVQTFPWPGPGLAAMGRDARPPQDLPESTDAVNATLILQVSLLDNRRGLVTGQVEPFPDIILDTREVRLNRRLALRPPSIGTDD